MRDRPKTADEHGAEQEKTEETENRAGRDETAKCTGRPSRNQKGLTTDSEPEWPTQMNTDFEQEKTEGTERMKRKTLKTAEGSTANGH
jgi:hypothetical protein